MAREPRSARRRGCARRAGLALVALVLVAGTAFLLRRAWLPHVAEAVAARWASANGWELRVGAFDGDWVEALTVRDVALISTTPDGALRELRATEVSVEWELWTLLAGDLSGLRSVATRGVRIELDATLADGGEPRPAAEVAWPESLPAVDLHADHVRVALPGSDSLVLSDVVLRGSSEPRITASVDWTGAPVEALRRPALAARIRYDAGRIEVREGTLGELAEGLRAELDLRRARVTASGTSLEAAWSATVDWSGGLRGDLSLEGASLEQLGRLAALPADPRGSVDVRAAFGLQDTLAVDGSLSARGLELDGEALGSATIPFRLESGELVVSGASATGRSSTVELRSAGVEVAELFAPGWPRSARLDLVFDTPDLVSALGVHAPEPLRTAPTIAARAELRVAGGELRLEHLSAGAASARLVVTDGNAPVPADLAPASLWRSLEAARARWSVHADDAGELAPALADLGPVSLDVTGHLASGELAWDDGFVGLLGSTTWLRPGRASSRAWPPTSLDDLRVAGGFDGWTEDLGALAVLVDGVEELAGAASWAGEVEGLAAAPTLRARATVRDARVAGAPPARIDATIRADARGRALRIDASLVDSPEARLSLALEDDLSLAQLPSAPRLTELLVGGPAPWVLVAPVPVDLSGRAPVSLALARGGACASIEVRRDGDGARLDVAANGLPLPENELLDTSELTAALDVAARLSATAIELRRPAVLEAAGARALVSGVAPTSGAPDAPIDLTLAAAVEAGSAVWSDLPPVLRPSSGTLEAAARLRGELGSPLAEIELGSRGLLLSDAARTPVALEARARIDEELVVERLELRASGQRLVQVAGTLDTGLPLARWIDGAPLPELGRLESSFDVAIGPFALASAADLDERVRRASGSVSGRLRVGGPLLDPSVEGSLDVDDAELSLGGGVPLIDGLRGRLRATDRTLTVESMVGEIGGSPFVLSGGVGIGPSPELALSLRGERVLLLRDDGVRIRADVDLAVTGSPRDALVSGEVVLVDSLVSRRLGLLEAGLDALSGLNRISSDESVAPYVSDVATRVADLLPPGVRLDVDVRSLEPLPVRSNVARAALSPVLRVSTREGVPTLDGAVEIEEARVSLPAGDLRLDSGSITFRGERPFEPSIDARFSGRLLGHDVAVDIEGPPDRLLAIPSSVPLLPREELVALIALGAPPTSVGGASQGLDAASSVAFYLVGDALARVFVGDSPEVRESFLSRLEWHVGREVSKSGAKSTGLTFRLTDDPQGRRGAVYLTGEEDVHDDANAGIRWVFRLP